mmetsp:Transcript_55712/g.148570  ORF Transcript_55712/g.148570 Transcript_55712/m.148570 type:complete len:372 (-) Transcript_55712:267-1382(-)
MECLPSAIVGDVPVKGKGKGKGSGKGPGAPPPAKPIEAKGQGKNGQTSLESAAQQLLDRAFSSCQFDDVAALTSLLDGETAVSLNVRSRTGLSLLHTASVNGSIRVVRMLLSRSAEIDAVNRWGETPLHVAAGANCASVLTELLGAGASVEKTDRWGRTSLGVARQNGYVAVADALLAAGAVEKATVSDEMGVPDAKLQAHQNDVAAEFMERVRLQPCTEPPQPVVRLMFENGARAASGTAVTRSRRALSKLVEYPGDPDAVARLLADPTVDPCGRDMFGLTALHKFAAWDKVDLLDALWSRLSEEDLNTAGGDEGFTAVHQAASMGAGRTLARLLSDSRVSRSTRDRKGRTAREVVELSPGLVHLAQLFD